MEPFYVRTDYNHLKICHLYDRACEFAGGPWCQESALCDWLYRNQSPAYFWDIFNRKKGIMKRILKDNGGDPDSPINGRLSGLFFMASVKEGSDSGEPRPMSPFGPYRLMVPAEDLLDTSNVYFADFYCMTNSGYHYVTLVITVPGSKADTFCKAHLPSVEITEENPFLFVNENQLYVTTKDRLLVEVFYTKDLDIRKYEHNLLTDIPTIGKGHSTPGGIPKYRSCPVCNL